MKAKIILKNGTVIRAEHTPVDDRSEYIRQVKPGEWWFFTSMFSSWQVRDSEIAAITFTQ